MSSLPAQCHAGQLTRSRRFKESALMTSRPILRVHWSSRSQYSILQCDPMTLTLHGLASSREHEVGTRWS